MDQLNELNPDFDDLKPWGRNIDKLYNEFVEEIRAGNLPGLTIEDLYKLEQEYGLR